MMNFLAAILAVLSIWDYPARQPMHERLRGQLIEALRDNDVETMAETCQKGVKLLPDDPTWQYNLACALAQNGESEKSLDALESAIDLGFRDATAIKNDSDLRKLSSHKRFKDLVEYAKQMSSRPLMVGPMATVNATGVFGQSIMLGEQNLAWDFDVGAFRACLELTKKEELGNTGDLYMNRDGAHSMLKVSDFPGLTRVSFDKTGRERGMDLDIPNTIFPYPVFGNASRAYTHPVFWRSLPRSFMTTDAFKLKVMRALYLSNQFWVFPSNADTPPIGVNGDIFPAQTPYCLITAGKSYSDQYYLRAALEASRSFKREVKAEIVRRRMLAPVLQTLLRKSLKGVNGEEDYLSEKAHPSAFPANSLDITKLKKLASEMKVSDIPPLAILRVSSAPISERLAWPELLFAEPFAISFVLRAKEEVRTFEIAARGATDYAFKQVHGDPAAVKIEKLAYDRVKITLKKSLIKPNNRVDIAIFAKDFDTEYGAPSFVSFAVVDPEAPYSDPFLTPQSQPGNK